MVPGLCDFRVFSGGRYFLGLEGSGFRVLQLWSCSGHVTRVIQPDREFIGPSQSRSGQEEEVHPAWI